MCGLCRSKGQPLKLFAVVPEGPGDVETLTVVLSQIQSEGLEVSGSLSPYGVKITITEGMGARMPLSVLPSMSSLNKSRVCIKQLGSN